MAFLILWQVVLLPSVLIPAFGMTFSLLACSRLPLLIVIKIIENWLGQQCPYLQLSSWLLLLL